LPSGIIIKGIGGFYYVETPQGLFECKARGIFRKNGMTPLPGDRVEIAVTDYENKKGSITEIGKRDSVLTRPAVANVDQVVIVIAVKSPRPDFLLLDKLLIAALMQNIKPIICVNKIDLDEDMEYKAITEAYSKTGYKIIPACSKTKLGYKELDQELTGKVTVFAGQSGVGKSTILNRLMDRSIMKTGELSEKIDRGKHTTRHAELIKLEQGGYVADTPGFSSFELKELPYRELECYYPDFQDFLGSCRFTGCSHVTEPGCEVRRAVEQGYIDSGRYNRYVHIYGLLKAEDENRYK